MKRILALLAVLACGAILWGSPRPGSQTFIGKNSQVYEDTNGNLTVVDGGSPGPMTLSGINVNGYTLSTTTISAGIACNYEYMYLSGTVSAKVGSALVAAAPLNSSSLATVTVAGATNDLTTLVGVSLVAASTGTWIPVATNGFVLALTTGTVNPGAVVVSTVAAAGYLSTNSNSVWGADFGLALSTGTAGGGLTLIKIRK